MEKSKNRRRNYPRSTASLSDNQLREKLINAIKEVWSLYDPVRKKALLAAKVYSPRYNKDGSVSKVPDVGWRCAACEQLTKKPQCDHIEPVGEYPPWPPTGDGSWDRYLLRQFCREEDENLQVLDKECHTAKTSEEKRSGAYKGTLS